MTTLLAEAAHSHPTWADFGPMEWITLVVAGAIAAWAIYKAVTYTLEPGETEPDHIKRSILAEPASLRVSVSSGALDDEVSAE